MTLIERLSLRFRWGKDKILLLKQKNSNEIEVSKLKLSIMPHMSYDLSIHWPTVEKLIILGIMKYERKQTFIVSNRPFFCDIILDHYKSTFNIHNDHRLEYYVIGNNIESSKELEFCKSGVIKVFGHIPEVIFIKEL